MTPPSLAAARVLRALALGAQLGAVYGFLRPLRPRHTTLSDLIFVLIFGWAWLYLAFGICGGDLRVGYLAAMVLGALILDRTAGKLLRPVFSGFWKLWRKIWGKLLLPGKKFFIFSKKLVASVKKWGKIKWSNRRNLRRLSGGEPHDPIQKPLSGRKGGIHPQPSSDQGGGDRPHCRVYGFPDRPAGDQPPDAGRDHPAPQRSRPAGSGHRPAGKTGRQPGQRGRRGIHRGKRIGPGGSGYHHP
ncbi:MAG: spore cortex biosynthesis protein YabQ [Oscillospiraceae bacterium]|nr:spore cortex biosynthesis protein YabQ [Oscillospiraceae bacterium]